METVLHGVKAVCAAVGAALSWVFGAPDVMLYTLLGCVALDYLTGLIGAGVHRELSSYKGFVGIAKKVVLFLVVGLASMLDRALLGDNGVLRGAVVGFFIANEGLSILENAGKVGLPIPTKLRDALAQLKDGERKGT